MNATEAWTVGKLLTWTTDYLKKNGSQSPRLDAEVLLAHARDCQRIELYTAFDEEPDDETKTAFREMVRRRAEGTPVAYLVGHKEFYSALFEVNPEVLIPRPETEHLVVEALDRAKQLRAERGASEAMLHIADVGTGSGIVGISLAKHLPHCQIIATDISPTAIQVARRNAVTHGLDEERYRVIEGDLLSACEANQSFDLIVSNPPYVSEAEFELLEKSVREFEPKQALVAGPEGSEIIVRLMEQSLQYLKPDGFLLFEFSPMLAEKLPAIVGTAWQSPIVGKDLAGHARIVTLRKTQA
jgi:release factor glutamine methyltransferase